MAKRIRTKTIRQKTEQIRCTDCGAMMRAELVSQEFEREGLRVKICGIPAAVCPDCGGISYGPGIADKVVTAARAMFDLAGDRHKGVFTAHAS